MKGRYDWEWRKLVARAIREHPWCAECRTPGTPANPLTGDHYLAHVRGGANEASNVRVLCRDCNSKKGARPAEATPQSFTR